MTKITQFFSYSLMVLLCTAGELFSQPTSLWQFMNGPTGTSQIYDFSIGKIDNEGSMSTVMYVADQIWVSQSTNGTEWIATPILRPNPLVVSVNHVNNGNNIQIVAGDKEYIYYSSDAGNVWLTKLDVNCPLKLYRSTSDGGIIHLGTKYLQEGISSLYKTTNGGEDWFPNESFNGIGEHNRTNVTDIIENPNNSQELWVSGRLIKISTKSVHFGIWHSTNNGVEWDHINTERSYTSLKMIEGELYAGGSNGKLYKKNSSGAFEVIHGGDIKKIFKISSSKSTDGITSILKINGKIILSCPFGIAILENNIWSVSLEKVFVYKLVTNPDDINTIYAATDKGLYFSNDNGTSWSTEPIKTSGVPATTTAFTENADYILALYDVNGYSYLSRFDKSTSEWTNYLNAFTLLPKESGFVGKQILFHSINANEVYASGLTIENKKQRAIIYKSTDNGLSWVRKYESATLDKGIKVDGITIYSQDKYYAYGKFKSKKCNYLLFTNDVPSTCLNPPDLSGSLIEDFIIRPSTENYYVAVPSNGSYYQYLVDPQYDWERFPDNLRASTVAIKEMQNGDEFVYLGGSYGIQENSIDADGIPTKTAEKKYDIQQIIPSSIPNSDKIYAIRNLEPNDEIIVFSEGLAETKIVMDGDFNQVTQIQFSGNADLLAATNKGIYKLSSTNITTYENTQPIHSTIIINNSIIRSNEIITYESNLIIPEGQTLTIEAGASLYFANGAKCIIRGSLFIEGTESQHVTMQPDEISVRWGGIIFEQNSTGIINYTDISFASVGILSLKSDIIINHTRISNSHIGVAFYGMNTEPAQLINSEIMENAWNVATIGGADVIMKNNLIKNGQKGLIIDASSPLLFGNTIEDNTQVGVVIYGGGYPRFGDYSPTHLGYNIVQGNNLTQILAVRGYAFLGYLNRDCINGLGGGNIIANTDPEAPLCVTVENSSLVAMQTNWGLATVAEEDFIYDTNSEIIYHCLVQGELSPQEDALWRALEQRGSGVYQNAIELYKYILTNYANTSEAIQALVELRATYEQLITEGYNPMLQAELQLYLQSLTQQNTNPDVVKQASSILAYEYANWGLAIDALEQYEQVLSLGLDEDSKISFLLSKLLLETVDLDYDDYAQNTLTFLQENYPNDERTQLAYVILSTIIGSDYSYGSGKRREIQIAMRAFPKKGNSISSETPTTFALQQNYPNPFNPVTTVKYQLPEDAKVTIKIYDLLGREVFTLVNGFEQAGYKQVEFDASRIASGVYFYKMQAGNFQSIRKFVLMK